MSVRVITPKSSIIWRRQVNSCQPTRSISLDANPPATGRWRNAKPEPLITPGTRTAADWIKEGERVFRELDIPDLRSYDPKLVEILRDAVKYQAVRGYPLKDGTVSGLRWVPTSKGLALGIQDCATCHSRSMQDGSILDGAPNHNRGDGVSGILTSHSTPGFLDFFSPGETPEMVFWRFWAAPWVPNDINERFKSPDIDARDFGFVPGIVPRFNGSPFYQAKAPDLIGIKDRPPDRLPVPGRAAVRARAVPVFARAAPEPKP